MNKKGATGEGILMIYRVILVTFVSLVIFGISAVFYSYSIDIRDTEAQIMTRSVVNCISPSGVVDLASFSDEDKINILSYCGFDSSQTDRFYVLVEIRDSSDETLIRLNQGDSGLEWVRNNFVELEDIKEENKLSKPGYFGMVYPTYVLEGQERTEGLIVVEVLVADEF